MEKHHPEYKSRKLSIKETLLPGLIEPHVHIVPTAMMTEWVDVGAFYGQDLSPKYDLKTVGAAINGSMILQDPDFVILGMGLDPSLMPFKKVNGKKELQSIDNTILVGINANHPMMLLSASMHTLYVNTRG